MNEVDAVARENLEQILASSSYLLAERDLDLLARNELRPVRLQLELLKPELALIEQQIRSTIVVFGSTQIVDPAGAAARLKAAEQAVSLRGDDPLARRELHRAKKLAEKSEYYQHARKFGRLVTQINQKNGGCDFVVVTGGGPGIMEAANRGAFDAEGKSIGLNILLPAEQAPNPYITPELCFQFHYFALRKLHFLLRAKALVVFPGGFGTLDELFDALTLRQTGRMQQIPIIMFGESYWRKVVDFNFLADEGAIEDAHLDLIQFVESPEQAWETIAKFHQDLGDPICGS